jgi:hypothetical protein
LKKFCIACGWLGSEDETKYKEWAYCKEHKVRIEEFFKDEKGVDKFYCRWGQHLVGENDFAVSKERSMQCPKCSNALNDVDEKAGEECSCEAEITDCGYGLITPRIVLKLHDKTFGWGSDSMLPIFPETCALVKSLHLKKGEKFRMTFSRLKKA